MQTKTLFLFFSFLFFFSHLLTAQTNDENEESDNLPVVEYGGIPVKYEIAGITVSGADNYEDFVIIGYSGLAEGDIVSIPGDEISNATKRFWRQGLFSGVKIYATRMEEGKVWLHIALKQQPRISAINFHGLKKSEIDELEPRLGLVKGSQITPNISDRAKKVIEKHMEEKGFANAEAKVLQRNDPDNPGSVIVDIEVDKKLKTKVNSININGNEALSFNQINRAMKKTNDPSWMNFFRTKKFVREEYEKDKATLIEKYNEIGYRDAYIVTDSVVTHDEKTVDVYITVHEGDKYYFRNINWVGNTIYPYEFLDNVLGIKKGDVYNYKLMNERLYAEDDAVSKLYQDRGYLFSHIEPVEVNFDGDSIDFEMRIFEGKPATINEINIIGNERVYEHVIRRELRTKPGQLYSQTQVIRTLRELAQMGHFDQEQLFADFQDGGISPNPEDGTVDLNYILKTKGSDQVEFSLGWGATGIVGSLGLKFTNFAIQNLFRPEMYRIVPQGEGQTFTINARTNAQYYNSVSLSFLEPWLGGKRPNSLSVSAYYAAQSRVSNRWNDYYSSMYNPYYGYGGYGYGSSYGYGYNDYQENYYNSMQYEIDPEKYMRTLGVSVGYGKRLSWPDDYFTFYGELSYQLYMLKEWYQILYPLGDGNYHTFSLNLNFSRNSIDNPIYTRTGSSFSLGIQLTPPYSLLRGEVDYASIPIAERYEKYNFIEYHKWKFSAKTFTPMSQNEKFVLMGRAEFAYLGHYNQDLRSPIGTYTLGGDGMSAYTSYGEEYIAMRGYDSGSLTPLDKDWGAYKGFLYNKFTLELRYPLSLEQNATIWALAFVEAGNSFSSLKEYNPFNLKRSAGLGVRIFLPMFGLMGIDWAYGFDPTNNSTGKGGSHFHFVLGQEL
ncbi:outer membrane protein assembly factor BamA [Paludibacter sp. 221]|uniref:BamA/OMP85 family outer membrane protein n=1 Tax=Paludibacter sp. 221 TaxID=2302939 RepID=UPI0013D34A8D|nr:POTRA domain-containing protein [Paludibacter sp. 221]NDV47219.1 outer membrane protein assembly factor BamA [Paludibacter sp. 221]